MTYAQLVRVQYADHEDYPLVFLIMTYVLQCTTMYN